jgi:hypothetical protein
MIPLPYNQCWARAAPQQGFQTEPLPLTAVPIPQAIVADAYRQSTSLSEKRVCQTLEYQNLKPKGHRGSEIRGRGGPSIMQKSFYQLPWSTVTVHTIILGRTRFYGFS